MRALDLFCGRGGWSEGFNANGFECVGIDIMDVGYPYHLILQDVKTLDGKMFKDFDVIIGSPPCRDFSVATHANKSIPNRIPPDPQKGLELIHHFERIVREARPTFWAMENVRRLEKFYDRKPIWHFYVSVRGKRSLWGNLQLPMLPDMRFTRNMEWDYCKFSYKERSILRAKIPFEIADIVAKAIIQNHTTNPTDL